MFQDKLPHHSYDYSHPEILATLEPEASPPAKEQKVAVKNQVSYSVIPSSESSESLFLPNWSEPWYSTQLSGLFYCMNNMKNVSEYVHELYI